MLRQVQESSVMFFTKRKMVKVRESLIYLLLRKSQDYHAMPCEM